ncbi:MAG: PAS domain-containing protein, partial [Elusimicrobia bacterium]|nr:PAS domain-containing protein [Elusimicrobiota bacterium]
MVKKSEDKSMGKNNNIVSGVRDIFHKKKDQYYVFQTLIDNIPDYIYIKDGKSRFIMVNKAMADFLCSKPDDFIGKTDFDILPLKSAKEFSKNDIWVINNKKPINNICEKITHKGKEFCLSSTKIPLFDENGNIMGVIGISRNINKKKQLTDDALSYENNPFEALMDNIPDSIYFKDKKSRFVLISKALVKRFGLKKPEDAIGKTDFDFFEKEIAKQLYDTEQDIIKTGKP